MCAPTGTNANWSANFTSMEFVLITNSSSKHNVTVNIDNLRQNYGGGAFKQAQVILTFDGGWNSTYYNASQIMNSNHQTGTMYLVTNQVYYPNNVFDCPVCITKPQLNYLYNDGWDVASHTVDHSNLVTNNSAHNIYQLANSFLTLSEWGFGANSTRNTAQFFAYPNGAYNSTIIGEVKADKNYTMARTLGFGIGQPNIYLNNPYNLSYRIQSIVITPDVTISSAERYINDAIAENSLLIFTFHVIQPHPCSGLSGNAYTECTQTSVEYSTANFTAISNYLAQEQGLGLLHVTNFSSYYATLNQSTIFTSTTTISTTSTSTSSTSTTTILQNETSEYISALKNNGFTNITANPEMATISSPSTFFLAYDKNAYGTGVGGKVIIFIMPLGYEYESWNKFNPSVYEYEEPGNSTVLLGNILFNTSIPMNQIYGGESSGTSTNWYNWKEIIANAKYQNLIK